MSPVCSTCNQSILEGEMSFDRASDAHHTRASDCVAATARRCAEITENSPTALIAIQRIRAEFKLEPK